MSFVKKKNVHVNYDDIIHKKGRHPVAGCRMRACVALEIERGMPTQPASPIAQLVRAPH